MSVQIYTQPYFDSITDVSMLKGTGNEERSTVCV